MKLRIRLQNFKGVFARMWFNIAMTSDRLSFASVEIDKSYSFTLPPWKNLCHRWLRNQPRPGSLFPTTREAEERDPGNEVEHSRPLHYQRHEIKQKRQDFCCVVLSLETCYRLHLSCSCFAIDSHSGELYVL